MTNLPPVRVRQAKPVFEEPDYPALVELPASALPTLHVGNVVAERNVNLTGEGSAAKVECQYQIQVVACRSLDSATVTTGLAIIGTWTLGKSSGDRLTRAAICDRLYVARSIETALETASALLADADKHLLAIVTHECSVSIPPC